MPAIENGENAGSAELDISGEKFTVTKDMVQIAEVEEKVSGQSIIIDRVYPSPLADHPIAALTRARFPSRNRYGVDIDAEVQLVLCS